MKKFPILFGMFILLLAVFVFAQNDRKIRLSNDAPAQDLERRVALVIGNSKYSVGLLPNPVNDATDIAKVLGDVGFKVTLKTDLNYKQMIQAIQAFGKEIQNGGVGLFYFGGHGVQVNGENYLIPVGTNIEKESEIPYESVNSGWVLAQMESARNRLNIIILDACRNNPFTRSGRSGDRGLRIVSAPAGTFIAFATAPGQIANDGTGSNSPYTEALLEYIPQPGLKIEEVFKKVLTSVRRKTDDQQLPWVSNSFEGDFCFVRNCAVAPAKSTNPVSATTAENSNLTDSSKQEHVEVQTYTETINQVGIEMVRVPSGKFMMGSPLDEKDRQGSEGPQHEVTLSSFYLDKYEVTQAQWRAVSKLPKVKIELPSDPSKFKGDNLPVEQVNWEEAIEFCARLSSATGKRYRLPTEAEWEYACRAGIPGMNAGDIESMAWYGVLGTQTHPVGKKKPNRFGLYDMYGNVWEWCQDWFSHDYYSSSPLIDPKGPEKGSERVIRGGSWNLNAYPPRSAMRSWFPPTTRRYHLGFRIARAYS